MKRNGDVLFKEHWVFGFAVEAFGPIGAFLGAGRQKGGELFTTRPVAHKAHGIDLELGEWTWIAFGSDKDRSVFYQDGKVVDRDGAYVFNRVLPRRVYLYILRPPWREGSEFQRVICRRSHL